MCVDPSINFVETDPDESYTTIAAHGGTLVNRFLPEDRRNEIIDRIEKYPSITLSSRQWSDIEMIANGAYSPLTGFVGEQDYKSIITNGRLSSGLAWTIPIFLLVEDNEVERLRISNDVILRDNDGKNISVLHLSEIFKIDKVELASRVWQTTDINHPGVRNVFDEGDIALAGSIDVVRLEAPHDFREFRLPRSKQENISVTADGKALLRFRLATLFIAHMNICRKLRLRWLTDSCCILLSVKRKVTTYRQLFEWSAITLYCKIIILRTGFSFRSCRRQCVMPARRKRSITQSFDKTTAARISSSAAIMRGSAAIMVHTTRKKYSMGIQRTSLE